MRIAHLSAEVSPFAKTGGLGDVVGALPKAQAALGHDMSVWMPLYRQVWGSLSRLGQTPEPACDPFVVHVGFRPWQVGILKTHLPGSTVPVYMVGSDPHFDRPHIYSAALDGRDDGLERYAVFVRAALATMKLLGQIPDVLHAHDWHAALAPMALAWDRPEDAAFEDTTTILTIHNMAYQGMSSAAEFVKLGLPRERFGDIEWSRAINLMKGGLLSADAITAVSPNFARELCTAEGGFGLDPIVRARRANLHGIVNGIDGSIWDPAMDPWIPFNYDAIDLAGKREDRIALLSLCGMDKRDPGFLVAFVGRLTSQKGLDLLFPVAPVLMAEGIRFVVLGSGEDAQEAQVLSLSHRAAGRFFGFVGFHEELAHLIYAGADALLMPSRFEPCGLNQLYALAYGTPPIVRRVGGLADTVIPFDGENDAAATGFAFEAPHGIALRDSLRWARRCYHEPALWTRIIRNGMAQDFRWEHSARRYVDLYGETRTRRRQAR